MYQAKFSHKDQVIEIKFDIKAMREYWPSYFDSGAHEDNLNELKNGIDKCIRKAYGSRESSTSLAFDTAALSACSSVPTAKV